MKSLLAGDPEAPAPVVPTPVAAPAAPTAPEGEPVPRNARIAKPPPARVAPIAPTAAAPAGLPPSIAPSVVSAVPADDEPRSTTPIANKAQLRAAMELVEPQVRACIEQHGANLTGSAVLTWTVASKGGQSVVETTGVDYDETTFDQAPLLDCLQKTAEQMQFAPAPGTLPVTARRKVAIEGGQLAAQTFISFSRIY